MRQVRTPTDGKLVVRAQQEHEASVLSLPHTPCRNSARRDTLEGRFVELLQRLQPDPVYAALFTEILAEVWSTKNEQSRQDAARLEQELVSAREQLATLKRRFVRARDDDQPIYREEIERVAREIQERESALAEAQPAALDVSGLLEFSRYLMTNAARVWTDAASRTSSVSTGLLPRRSAVWLQRIWNRRNVLVFQSLTGRRWR